MSANTHFMPELHLTIYTVIIPIDRVPLVIVLVNHMLIFLAKHG